MGVLDCPSLTSIVIPDSVNSIGSEAFAWCTSLTSIMIPDSVTSIGDWAFYGCTSLTSIVIPDSVTRIGDWAFASCSSLTGVTIPNRVSGIEDGAFHGCTSLTNITIPDQVSSIGDNAFAYTGLTNIAIPANVTSIGDLAFEYCGSLISVTIGNSVSSIGDGAFASCSSLAAVYFEGDAPKLDGDRVFDGTSATIYYLPGTLGWRPTFGGRPTMPWGVVWGSPVRGDVNGDERRRSERSECGGCHQEPARGGLRGSTGPRWRWHDHGAGRKDSGDVVLRARRIHFARRPALKAWCSSGLSALAQ